MNARRSLKRATVLVIAFAAGICAQTATQTPPGPAGGKTSDSAAAPPKKVPPKPAAAGTRIAKPARATNPVTRSSERSGAVLDSVNGKWWTTGNDFGTSQVFFEQNGTIVSGAIMYADGRTGEFSGVLAGKRINYNWTNSSGERGTGWLEHSWNNFLGGTYRNQKGVSGSWTLSRIAGNWCFGGSRDRIRKVTHNSRGQLFFLTEDSGEETGHLAGPWIFLHGELGDVKGIMDHKATRVDFATGTFWTWCGK